MLTRILIVVALIGGAIGCDSYSENDFELITAYTAKTMCMCLWVEDQTEEYCAAWTKENPPVASYRVDWKEKAVESQAMMLWGARAHFVSDRLGCILE